MAQPKGTIIMYREYAFGDDQNGRAVACAHDQIDLPVSGHLTTLHLGRQFADVDRSRNWPESLPLARGAGLRRGFLRLRKISY